MEQETARILVVDDDSELRLLIKEYLEKNGFTVDTVESGETMDGYLGNSKADLIILDLMLPGEHGLSIAQRLKKQMEIPIIIVSAQGDDVDRIVGLEIGADDYIRQMTAIMAQMGITPELSQIIIKSFYGAELGDNEKKIIEIALPKVLNYMDPVSELSPDNPLSTEPDLIIPSCP